MRTLAIIPAFDEDVAIGSVVLGAKQHVDEVLVVDDGSTDNTARVAQIAGATLLRNDKNAGKGRALSMGLAYARNNGYIAAVLLDADGQHDPADIPRLLEPILSGQSDLVVGSRTNGMTKMPRYRRVGNRILDYVTAIPAGALVADSQCGYRALSRKAIDAIALHERGFAVESEMIVEAMEKHLKISEVPVTVRYDVDGSTKGALAHGFGVVDGVLDITAVRHPLLLFGLPGLVLFAFGILGVVTLDGYGKAGAFPVGYAFLVAILLIIGCLSMFAGLMLDFMPKAFARALSLSGEKRTR